MPEKLEFFRKESQGIDKQTIVSLFLLNLVGGDCVNDLEKLEGDDGFCQVMRRIERRGIKRRERRELDRRLRKERQRVVPSPSPVRLINR